MDSSAASPTTVNGAAYAVIPGPPVATSDLRVSLGDGDDTLILGNVANFNADTAEAFDQVSSLLTGSNAAFADAQTTTLAIRDNVFLRLGRGDDLLGLDGLRVEHGLFVDMGSATHDADSYAGYDNFVGIFNSWAGGAWIGAHSGNDGVLIGSQPDDSVDGLIDDSADMVDTLVDAVDESTDGDLVTGRSIPGLSVGKYLCVSTGGGDDVVSLANLSAPCVGVALGQGNDNLTMANTSIWWLKADGGRYDDVAVDTIYGDSSRGVVITKREVWNFEETLLTAFDQQDG